ncbi:MAG: hypothetical protein U5K53_08615 [Halanaerobiales bacterium]|nr:hypothetical protein [Halanaerobiales bacterium]
MIIKSPISINFSLNKITLTIISFFIMFYLIFVFSYAVIAAPTISNFNGNSFQAKMPAEIVDEDITFSSDNYNNGYLEFIINDNDRNTSDKFKIDRDSSISTTNDMISIDDLGLVYRGTGGNYEIIGNIDQTNNGENGILRLDFKKQFPNGDFSLYTPGTTFDIITNWTIVNQRISFDRNDTTINGWATPTDISLSFR